MNVVDFFMKHAGYKLLPVEHHTGDVFADALKIFEIALPTEKSPLRLCSTWMVITPNWTATKFNVMPYTGFIKDLEMAQALRKAFETPDPFIFLSLGKGSPDIDNLYMTYHPKGLRKCTEKGVITIDATKEKWWTS